MARPNQMTSAFEHLLAPGRIGTLELRNRIFMSPMGSNLAEEDGTCGERIVRYYEARAQGGAALVTMGSVGIAWPRGSGNARQVAISEDRFIAPLRNVVDAVHSHGCRIALQLQHAGAISVSEPFRGFPFLVPSVPEQKEMDWGRDFTAEEHKDIFEAIFAPGLKFEFKEADEADIVWLIDAFASAAVRAREAGVDAVEIHAGHGYIISSFLSPASNKRADRYGGSLQNRARLLTEIIKGVKRAAGADYPVWFRLDSQEYLKPDGITLEDAIATARLGEAAGADAVHVSAYADASRGISFTEAHTVQQPCKYVPNAIAIKAAVSMPVIAVGRIEPEQAERLVADGKVDFVAMARKLLADPELPNRLREGRPELIRPCIYCYTCISQIFFGRHVRCAVNPQTAFESSASIVPSGSPKRVLVVGGGPAGLETARVAALRGHQVQLHEAGGRLGGTLFFSSIVYPENGRLIAYLERAVREQGVTVHLNSKMTAEAARTLAPDVIVVATGARRALVDVPGAQLPHVFSGDEMRELVMGQITPALAHKLDRKVRMALGFGRVTGLLKSSAMIRRLSQSYLPLGHEVVIYGGGLVGVELAEFLAERGRSVTVIEPGPSFGKELTIVRRWRLMDTIRRQNVRLLSGTRLLQIETDRVLYETKTGQVQARRAHNVIMALGAEPDGAVADELRTVCATVHLIGDAAALGYIDGAIKSGNQAGRTI
jgi:2,4-dienoyl-CoA reductase (NADPH2)